ncbi:hypothetical protein [Desulfobulbus alkaliphilus]|uniref:hypothetical protein n=1 Tax=Desulfobulbus alkaliphilus TaxID=869814 RepID=UPI001964CCCB|nr:hypothetical protein [Desulfobulbus alkaliphilus]MBM9538083.1 hypothetical protein [Desulfobulbus alkaliphilus]
MKNVCRSMMQLFIVLAFAGTSWAQTDVSGRYLAGGGHDVRIQLTIQTPPPAAFIVLQHIPPGVTIVDVSPRPSGFQPGAGTVKWFFRRPAPGTMTLLLRFSHPVALNRLAGEISYRHPGSEALITRSITAY